MSGDFEDFLTSRNDRIDNAAFELLNALSPVPQEWNMEIIGDIVDAVELTLIYHGVPVCHPWREDGTECYKCSDSCEWCKEAGT